MAYANFHLPVGFLRSVLHNGVGRHVPQLQRITIKFCKTHGGSRGVRDYIENGVIDFARENPATVVYLKPRRFRSPVLKAEYLNGESDWMVVSDFTPDEVAKWMEYMRNRAGFPPVKLMKRIHTDNPSIQGVWTPFSNKPTEFNITQFPNNKWSEMIKTELTATDMLLRIAEEQRVVGSSSGETSNPQNIITLEENKKHK